MNKSQLIDSIAKKAKLTKVDAKKVLDAFMDTTKTTLKKGEKVALVGWGTFDVRKRSARKGRNPQNPKQVINIPAKRVVKFSVGSELKKAVN